jgi:hypothetical protein
VAVKVVVVNLLVLMALQALPIQVAAVEAEAQAVLVELTTQAKREALAS